MKFLDLFDPITKGNHGLTDEAVYKSIQLGNGLIPLWGGNKDHFFADRFVDEKAKTKGNKPITVFNGDGIIISLDGSAGCMTYKGLRRFALNHHAGFIKRKVEASNLIDPEFFSIFYKEQLKEASISEGSRTLTPDMIYSMDFDIPRLSIQREVMLLIQPLLSLKRKTESIIEKMQALRCRTLAEQYSNYQALNVPVKDVLGYIGGNSGLTEMVIYQNICLSGERFRVLSGTVSEGWDI